MGTDEGTMPPTPKNPPSWHNFGRHREILLCFYQYNAVTFGLPCFKNTVFNYLTKLTKEV